MNTTFDRYLIARYLQIFLILFISMFGLYVVIDGFSNIDEFQSVEGTPPDQQGTFDVMTRMASYYAYQSASFLDLCGPILTVVDAMVVFALLQRNAELQPILAAGVPTWRLLLPVVLGTVLINGFMAVNQELIIPRIAGVLQTPRDAMEKGAIGVEAITDYESGIHIDGQELSLKPQEIKSARFLLPDPRIVRTMTTLAASRAVYLPASTHHPAGWLLKNVDTPYSRLTLTDDGRTRVRRLQNAENSADIFVVSEVTFDQLYNRLQSFKLLSTMELIRRLNSPALGPGIGPALLQHLHARLVRPLANILAVLVSIPLILRKESYGLVTNMAIASAILCSILGASEAVAYFGRAGAISPHLAAWIPVIGTGTLFAWLSGMMQT